jgi:hypothetical protein
MSDHILQHRELRKIPDRMMLYPRDVMNILGKGLRASQRLVQKIRMAYGRTGPGGVTIKEFCTYCSFDEEEIKKYLRF